jgi:hypothetical protein
MSNFWAQLEETYQRKIYRCRSREGSVRLQPMCKTTSVYSACRYDTFVQRCEPRPVINECSRKFPHSPQPSIFVERSRYISIILRHFPS